MPRKILAFLLLGVPAAAGAFEGVDSLPAVTRFPAYFGTGEETRPREYWAQAGVMRDDNVLRSPTKTAETVYRYGLGARATQRIFGRQSLRLEARGEYYDFDQLNTLDHLAYGLLGEWLWELGNQLSGTLGYSRTRAQADLAERSPTREDMITVDRFAGTAAYRFAADWRLRAAVEAASFRRPEFREAEIDERSLAAGIDYVTPLDNALGIEVRATDGDALVPQTSGLGGAVVNNDYKEHELAAVASYRPGYTLRLDGRLGRTKREYKEVPGRNFDGTTWRAGVEWAPGTKTILRFDTYKVPRSITDVGPSHIVLKGVSFGPTWAPTVKLVLAARLVSETREFQGGPGTALGLAPLLKEDDRLLRLALGWEPQRRFRLGLGFDTGERTSNTLGRDYDYTAWTANLRYTF
jgi:hypothetical protein